MSILRKLLIPICLILISTPLWAAGTLNNVTVAPTTVTVIAGINNQININWTTFISSDINVTGDLVATSTQGQFSNGLGTIVNTLSHNYGQINNLNNATHVYNESLTITAAIINQYLVSGSRSNLTYTRTFNLTEGGIPSGTDQASVTINIVQPSNISSQPLIGLNITRSELRFDNQQLTRIVGKNSKLKANAVINYTNAGLFDAVWEVATPASTRSTPIFRTLKTFRQYLGAGRQVVIESPLLPTENKGLYLLRLRIRKPVTGFESTVLRYIVNEKAGGTAAIPSMQLGTPIAKAMLTKQTEFRWRPVRNATAYQLELYDHKFAKESRITERELEAGRPELTLPPTKKPSSGVLVPGSQTRLSLTTLSREHLQSGNTYYWRVLAIGNLGNILAISPLREIRVP